MDENGEILLLHACMQDNARPFVLPFFMTLPPCTLVPANKEQAKPPLFTLARRTKLKIHFVQNNC